MPRIQASIPQNTKKTENTIKAGASVGKNFDSSHKEHKVVKFNLNNVKSLSGSEKILLLRDLIATKSHSAAINVWNLIIKNSLSNQLIYRYFHIDYSDYHCLLHMLITNPIKYKEELIQLNEQIRLNLFLPSENLLNEFLKCAVKWKDVSRSIETFNEIKTSKLLLETDSCADLLGLLSKSTNIEIASKGFEVWDYFTSQRARKKPSRAIYLRLFDLYARVQDEPAVSKLYETSVDEVIRLNRERANTLDKKFGIETRLKFLNAYMAVLVQYGSFLKALELFDEFRSSKYFSKVAGLSSLKDTFRILFKICASLKHPDLADDFYKLTRDLAVDLDIVMFGRLISIPRLTSEETFEYLQTAIIRLQIQPSTKHFISIYESAIKSLSSKYPLEAFKCFETIRSGANTLKMHRITYLELLENLKEYEKEFSIVSDSFLKDYSDYFSSEPPNLKDNQRKLYYEILKRKK